MLANFCHPCLRPEIHTNTISTEGHEVTNLISDPCNGFLAYSCIKPPVDIDLTFVCNIQISHILIWPSIGSQKSSGFQLYGKTTNNANVPYTLLSTGYLSANDAGLLFYSADIDPEQIQTPPNFLKRYIKMSLQPITMYANSLRISICKTQNSVPALEKIEVWGTVSPRCGKDVTAGVNTLWSNCQRPLLYPSMRKQSTTDVESNKDDINNADSMLDCKTSKLHIPEDFLDPITWEIMIQPVTLPSGNIIDQSTLKKHEENEALWGRPASDPFTGIPFNKNRRPVVAASLKVRIDKFLLENSDADEIKRLPRVLGHRSSHIETKKIKMLQVSENATKDSSTQQDSKNQSLKSNYVVAASTTQKKKKSCHQLPSVIMCPKQSSNSTYRPAKKQKTYDPSCIENTNICDNTQCESTVVTNANNDLDKDIQSLLCNLKRFNEEEQAKTTNEVFNKCNCCTTTVLYQLPCKHIVCRKLLLPTDKQCRSCGQKYETHEVQRIFV